MDPATPHVIEKNLPDLGVACKSVAVASITYIFEGS